MSNGAAREAFDLFHPACRLNFRYRLSQNWKQLRWWQMVFQDTVNRVCSRRQP